MVFRTALLESELELKIVRSTRKPPIPPKSNSLRASQSKSRPTLAEIQPNNVEPSFIDHDSNLNALNTRRLGKIVKINLTKGKEKQSKKDEMKSIDLGTDGLGFKLASRDNPTGAANPIYVKTIFSKGAAIDDGRLQRGDRLLAVNSIDVTQMSLQETVALLRDTRVGDNVELCISRQSEGSTHHDSVRRRLTIHWNVNKRHVSFLDTRGYPDSRKFTDSRNQRSTNDLRYSIERHFVSRSWNNIERKNIDHSRKNS